MSARRTTIFAKRPVPGAVKTRLVPPLTPEEAAALAGAMLRDVVARCAASDAFATALRHAPADAAGWFRATFPEVEDQGPQRGADLGASLALHFDDALADGGTEVVVGSDAPLLATARMAEAHARLEADADLVLAPDPGGGYALVGLRRPCPALFTEVEMSTPDMRARTEALARARGLAVARLEPADDVDVPADLDRLRAALAAAEGLPEFPRHTARAVASIPSRTP